MMAWADVNILNKAVLHKNATILILKKCFFMFYDLTLICKFFRNLKWFYKIKINKILKYRMLKN
jgi:hypothetical protein